MKLKSDILGVSRGDWTGSIVALQFSQVPPDRSLVPSGYLYIYVGAELDTLYETYRAREVKIRSAPASYPWGLREFTIEDLNGHILRFGTHL